MFILCCILLSELELWEENDSELDVDKNLFPSITPDNIELDTTDEAESSVLLKWIVFFILHIFKQGFQSVIKAFIYWLPVLLRLFLDQSSASMEKAPVKRSNGLSSRGRTCNTRLTAGK